MKTSRITTKRLMTTVANEIERELKEVANIFTTSELKVNKFSPLEDCIELDVHSGKMWLMTMPVIQKLIGVVSHYTNTYEDVFYSFDTYPYKQTEDGNWQHTPNFHVAIRMKNK